MTGSVIFLILLFGGIAIWVAIRLFKGNRKPLPRPRPHVIAPSPIDPWGTLRMRRRERESLPGGHSVF